MKKSKGKKIMIITISIIALIALLFSSILFISGAFEKATYMEPWDKEYYEQFSDPREQLVAHGLLAASGHNMQPWKIVLDEDPDIFYLYADASRLTPEADPLARQLMITMGTFIEYVSIAGNTLGYDTNVQLFPNGLYDEENLIDSIQRLPVAKFILQNTTPKVDMLYEFMYYPDTNRNAYMADKLTEQNIELLNAQTGDGLSISVYQDEDNIQELSNISMEAMNIEAAKTAVMKEAQLIFRPNEYAKNKYKYGFSVEGQGTEGIMKHIKQAIVTLIPSLNSGEGAAKTYIESAQLQVDNTPAYLTLISQDNGRIAQVKSGMTYSRLVLAAHSAGLVMQPISQALQEYQELSEVYNNIHSEYGFGGTIQMLVRIGSCDKQAPLTMRMGVNDLM